MAPPLKLLIADDSKYLIDGAVLSLSDYNVKIVGKLEHPDDVLKSYKANKPDVVITDIMFGVKKTGIDVLDELIEFDKNARVIVFSQYDDDDLIKAAYSKGAKAFLTKNVDEEILFEAILAASEGKTYFVKEVAERMAMANMNIQVNAQADPKRLLSSKEMEVFQCIAVGLTQPEISEKLHFSPRTVATLSKTLKDKLHVSRNADITLLAVKHKYITV